MYLKIMWTKHPEKLDFVMYVIIKLTHLRCIHANNMYSRPIYWCVIALKIESRHDNKFVITGSAAGCDYDDNSRCPQWR